MYCNRGSTTTESTHEVKTLAKAKEWFSDVLESDLPIKVNQHTAANGRIYATIFNNRNEQIHRRG